MLNNIAIAAQFLHSLGKPCAIHIPQYGRLPPLKEGWQMKERLIVSSPFYNIRAEVHFAMYNSEMVVFGQAFDAINLVKPEVIEATFLHLQMALLMACETGMFTPEALATMRLVPAIPGVKMRPNFPLAFAALRYAIDNPETDEPLPF